MTEPSSATPPDAASPPAQDTSGIWVFLCWALHVCIWIPGALVVEIASAHTSCFGSCETPRDVDVVVNLVGISGPVLLVASLVGSGICRWMKRRALPVALTFLATHVAVIAFGVLFVASATPTG